jgi:carboxymethylenebutenolidase
MGRSIDIPVGEGNRCAGYLAAPPSGKGPGLMSLHTAFGLDRYMRETADLLAEEGYVVLCPDLYWRQAPGLDLGQTEADRQRMLALDQRFDDAAALADIALAIAALGRKRPGRTADRLTLCPDPPPRRQRQRNRCGRPYRRAR